MSTSEFKLLVDRANHGNPPGPGWGIYDLTCPHCRRSALHVVPIGSQGFRCPFCELTLPEFKFLPVDNPYGWDGAFTNPVGWELATICLN